MLYNYIVPDVFDIIVSLFMTHVYQISNIVQPWHLQRGIQFGFILSAQK